ncbi:MAG: YfhO family protein [Oscillospiraceae bacterium]|nr:YfhO family protein [Oscillospiraceae bacterium]
MKPSTSKKKNTPQKQSKRAAAKKKNGASLRTEVDSPLLEQSKSRLPLLLAFLLPFAAACIVLSIAGLSPFGDKTILIWDSQKQYYPFFKAFREKLLSGGSLQYTWDVGMGTGYASLYAYYLASPLNWLCVLVPASALPEFFALLTVVKIACAGLFFAIFLRIVYRRNDVSIAFFALLYAFCSWTAGYYWNNMWLDTFALLPLLVAGTVCLLRDGRFRLYIIALALSLWCNYYLAYFCCIFVLLTFVIYCVVCWQGFKSFLRRFLRIGVSTLIGVGLTAVLLLPTLKAMMNSYASAGGLTGEWGLNLANGGSGISGVWRASRTILSNLMPDPSVTDILPAGLPNIYCGFCAVVLAITFFCCGKVSLREKLCSGGLLIFLLMSFIFRKLDYLWHGFHFPNGLPYRFSFLFSFVTIALAYRAYTLMDSFKKWYLAIIVPVAGLLILNAAGRDYGSVKAAILVLAAVVAALLVYNHSKARRVAASAILFAVIAAETISCFAYGIKQADFALKTDYLRNDEEIQTLLAAAQAPDGFGRTELTVPQTRNDGALHSYRGASIFTSSANANFNRFSPALGLSSLPVFNWYLYWETSPLSNTLCGIRYLLDCEGRHRDPVHNTLIATEGNVNLLHNNYYISAGFMTESEASGFTQYMYSDDPIRDQNGLFQLATGVHEDVYVPIPCEKMTAWTEGSTIEPYFSTTDRYFRYSCGTERSTFSVFFRADTDGLYCATTRFPNLTTVYVYLNGQFVFDRYITSHGMFSLGRLSAGDEIQLVYFVDPGWQGYFSADVARMDDIAFRRGYDALADEPWELTEVSDTRLSGTVTALRDGLFYTSIPYEPGWTATVDGEEVALAATFDPAAETVKLTDAVIAFPLSEGTHTVTLRYQTPGLVLGGLISAVSLLAFAGLLYLRRKEHTLFPDPPEVSGTE